VALPNNIRTLARSTLRQIVGPSGKRPLLSSQESIVGGLDNWLVACPAGCLRSTDSQVPLVGGFNKVHFGRVSARFGLVDRARFPHRARRCWEAPLRWVLRVPPPSAANTGSEAGVARIRNPTPRTVVVTVAGHSFVDRHTARLEVAENRALSEMRVVTKTLGRLGQVSVPLAHAGRFALGWTGAAQRPDPGGTGGGPAAWTP
jgi:hypothetical protein